MAWGTCNDCPHGYACGADNQCHKLCSQAIECGLCEFCSEGRCEWRPGCQQSGSGYRDSEDEPFDESISPCDSCDLDHQVCIAAECREVCDVNTPCPSDWICVIASDISYCIRDENIQAQTGDLGLPVEERISESFEATGGLSPTIGRSKSKSFILTPPIQ